VGVRLRGELTELRAATEEDAALLVEWHGDPDVARYWDGETFTHSEMLERLRRPNVEALVVEERGRPIGYLQVWSGEEPGTGGLDMFLVPDARGRRLGPDAARAVARHLVEERGWTRLTVDPYRWNEAAVRAWRRAGFVDVEERPADEEHAEPWLLLEFTA
jgi:aminoglycoside 6'-N-acetyltransferase